jgi:hypothetical protein
MTFKRNFCLVLIALFIACSSISLADEKGENGEIFQGPESLIRGLYTAVTFQPGTLPDWEYVRSFFIPEAVFGVRKTRTNMEVLDLDGFVGWWLEDVEKHDLEKRGLEETIEKMKLIEYRNIAHCFVVYKVRILTPADSPGQLGLDSYSLMKKEGRWWIISVANDVITPQNPLPDFIR